MDNLQETIAYLQRYEMTDLCSPERVSNRKEIRMQTWKELQHWFSQEQGRASFVEN